MSEKNTLTTERDSLTAKIAELEKQIAMLNASKVELVSQLKKLEQQTERDTLEKTELTNKNSNLQSQLTSESDSHQQQIKDLADQQKLTDDKVTALDGSLYQAQ